MTLSNQKLLTLSQFATKARNHLGIIKVADMFNNDQYAFDLLTKATVTGNEELVEISKKISNEFNLNNSLINAIDAYINNLKSTNKNDDFLHDSKYHLIKLAHHLYEIKIDGISYRNAVENLLLNVDANERTFCINLARKFYRFWRAAYNLSNEVSSKENKKQIAQKEAFIKLWDNLEQELISDGEQWPLSLYEESMRQIGLLEKDIIISLKVAKVITLELRNEINNPDDNYRKAISKTKALFERQDLKTFLVIVSREFYKFWSLNIQQNMGHENTLIPTDKTNTN